MNWLFLLVSALSVIALTAQGVLIKRFGDKRPGAEITYTFVSAVCAFVLFGIIALASHSRFDVRSVPYSMLFALCYAGSTVTYVLAVGSGSLALTTTIHSFALIIPTVLGFVLWDEQVNAFKIVGIVLFAAALLLMGEKAEKGDKILSTKWIILITVSFFCEGFAPVAIKLHSLALGEKAASEGNDVFMVMAYAVAFVGIFVAALLKEGRIRIPSVDGKKTKNFMLDSLKIALPLASLGGIFNGLYNLMNTVVANKSLNVSVFFPVVSAGQLIFTCVVAVVFFKEKLTVKQLCAIFCGMVAIVLINI